MATTDSATESRIVENLPSLAGECATVLFSTAHRDQQGGIAAGRTIASDFIANRANDLSVLERVELTAEIAATVGLNTDSFRRDSVAHPGSVEEMTAAMVEIALHQVLNTLADGDIVPREDGRWVVDAPHMEQWESDPGARWESEDDIEYIINAIADRVERRYGTDATHVGLLVDEQIEATTVTWGGSVVSDAHIVDWIHRTYDADGSEYMESEQVKRAAREEEEWHSAFSGGVVFHALRYAMKQEVDVPE